jgi:urease accessory protein
MEGATLLEITEVRGRTAPRAALMELLLADGRTPTGSFADSGGLEPLLAECPVATPALDAPGGLLERFTLARLASVGLCDAAVAVRAARWGTVEELLALELEWAARCPSPALRAAAGRTGYGLLRTARTWWPGEDLLTGYARASALTPRPVVLGAVARTGGLIEPARIARLSLYEDLAAVLAAAVKLAPLDAAACGAVALRLAEQIENICCAAARAGSGDGELPSVGTPLLELRAERHARLEGRLFAS